jgi:arabinan endo-1,5-alpha-L-arabinosidase
VVRHNGYYYLFVSMDFCCRANPSSDDYKQVVGRGTSVHGPFVSMDGTPMIQGGGNVLISSGSDWNAPGGGSVYIDPETGESALSFHALNMSAGGRAQLWVKRLGWQNDWPVLP